MNKKLKWLETKRLTIYHPDQSSYNFFIELLTNEEVKKFIISEATEKQIKKDLSGLIKHYNVHGFSAGVVMLNDTKKFIGRAGLYFKELDGEINLCLIYHLLPQYWRKGYGTEMVRSLINFSFKTLKHNKILVLIESSNTSSLKLLQKFNPILNGFVTFKEKKHLKYFIHNKNLDSET
tara:strand:- start:770 stop:1303 length:534 start_codon:yes stop_codon:yes gene_type:complete